MVQTRMTTEVAPALRNEALQRVARQIKKGPERPCGCTRPPERRRAILAKIIGSFCRSTRTKMQCAGSDFLSWKGPRAMRQRKYRAEPGKKSDLSTARS